MFSNMCMRHEVCYLDTVSDDNDALVDLSYIVNVVLNYLSDTRSSKPSVVFF